MTFSTIGNQASIRRGGNYSRYVAVHTPVVEAQFNPSADASNPVNGTIPYSTLISGDISRLRDGMLAYITPTSDYQSDVETLRADEYAMTYIRKDAVTGSVYIGETAFQWTTSDVVTVLDFPYPFIKNARLTRAGLVYKSFDETYRAPLPIIYDLEAQAVEIASGDSTTTIAFTPSVEVIANGASVSAYSWQVPASGVTFDTGTATDQNVTLAFEAGTHMVWLTVTDSNGNASDLGVLIVAVPFDYNSVVDTVLADSLDYDGVQTTSGFSTKTASSYVPNSPALMLTKARYGDGTSQTVTNMVGWLNELTDDIRGDLQLGVVKQLDYAIIDVARKLSELRIPGYPAEQKDAPAEWGELVRVTPFDVAWFAISEHSTVANCVSIDPPASFSTYTFPAIDINNGTLQDTLDLLLFRQEGATVNYSPNGTLVCRRNLFYDTDANRNSADTIVALSLRDMNVTLQRPPSGVFAVQAVKGGFGYSNTTTNKEKFFEADAPATTNSGVNKETVDGITLPADTTPTNAAVLSGRFTANHWQASNENLIVNLEVNAGYFQIVPNTFQWLTLDVAAATTLTGVAYDSNTRFVVLSSSQSYDAQAGSLSVSLQLREETTGGDDYATIVRPILTTLSVINPSVPLTVPDGITGDEFDDLYGAGASLLRAGGFELNEPDAIADSVVPEDVSNLLEILRVPFKGGVVTSETVLALGSNYLLEIDGEAFIRTTDAELANVTFDPGGDSFGIFDGAAGTANSRFTLASGNSLQELLVAPIGDAAAEVQINLGSELSIASVSFDYFMLRVNTNPAAIDGFADYRVIYRDSGGNEVYNSGNIVVTDTIQTDASASWQTNSATVAQGQTGVQFIRVRSRLRDDDLGASGAIRAELDNVVINAQGGAGRVPGDAFYYDYYVETKLYTSGRGLQINGFDASPYPTYDASHSYDKVEAGDNTQLTLEYIDQDGDYTDNDNRFLEVRLRLLP